MLVRLNSDCERETRASKKPNGPTAEGNPGTLMPKVSRFSLAKCSLTPELIFGSSWLRTLIRCAREAAVACCESKTDKLVRNAISIAFCKVSGTVVLLDCVCTVAAGAAGAV